MLVLAAALVGGCQSLPERIDSYAASQGMARDVVEGQGFHHVLYRKPGNDAGTLHVYLEGDGRPWLKGLWPADDPTPARPLALELMARDPTEAVLLGRPCYNGRHTEPACRESLWTSGRYSPEVVVSLSRALKRYTREHGFTDITLIGYSGGGALAVLVASRMPGVRRVLTVSANLDIDAWTRLHGYLPLDQSLNPMTQARLDGIAHFHLGGAEDSNVPPDMITAFARRHGGTAKILPDYDHRCCWRENWPQLLREALAITENPGAETGATAQSRTRTRPPGNRHEP